MSAVNLQKQNQPLLTQFIKQKPLITFFILSFAVTWGVDLLFGGLLGLEPYIFTHISCFGPVLAAMFVSAVIHPKKAERKLGSWLTVFMIAILVAGLVRWLSRIWWHHSLDWSVLPGDLLLVLLAAFVFAGACSGNDGIRSLLKPYLNWRISWIWLLFAIGFWPAMTYAGYIVGKWLGLATPAMPAVPDVSLLLAVPVSFVWALFFNGALGEEAGWRGFALPRLQLRFSPLVASLILGFFWGSWHWILDFMGVSRNPLMFWVRFGDIPLAILYTWLYNRTKGKSLLPVLLLHAAMNGTNDYLPRVNLTVFSLLGIAVLVVIFTDRMWRFKPVPETATNGIKVN